MSDGFDEKTAEINKNQIKCKDCAGTLNFTPGTSNLKCQYCGTDNEIVVEKANAEEIDFEKFLSEKIHTSEEQQISTVKCGECGASTTLAPNVTSDNCPFCATPLIIANSSIKSIVKPKYMLPFKIERKKADGLFKDWVGSLWFAPNDLKSYVEHSKEKLNGMYMPYWTYDSSTSSDYSGMRGDYYYVSESYTDSEGNSQTREVRKTAWIPSSGGVHNSFDDILVCASKALPDEMTRGLEPWDLPELVNYNEGFLSGFKTESYQVEVKEGFDVAKKVMEEPIKETIRGDIGGDEQQIITVNTKYNDVTFKHILLPLWISAYRYGDKPFRFTINARTGEVHGERPYSAAKIILLVVTIIAVIAGGIYLWKSRQQ